MSVAKADTRNMKVLVTFVIIMGVLIVVGLVVVVVTIASRLGGEGRTATSATPPAFGTVDLPVAAGCQVAEASAAGERLILRLGSGERCNQVLIVDLTTGRLLGNIRLVPTQ
jgi:hypothetical protein